MSRDFERDQASSEAKRAEVEERERQVAAMSQELAYSLRTAMRIIDGANMGLHTDPRYASVQETFDKLVKIEGF